MALPAKVHVLEIHRLFGRFGHFLFENADKLARTRVPVAMDVLKAFSMPQKLWKGKKREFKQVLNPLCNRWEMIKDRTIDSSIEVHCSL